MRKGSKSFGKYVYTELRR
nr:hypothetical protein [Sulfolobus islandicus]